MTAALRAVIERLEAATGPDRQLDWEIHVRNGLEGVGMYGAHPHYTTSVDAALTLLPEGWGWSFNSLRNIATIFPAREEDDKKPYRGVVYANHWTAPLALCIASLRARLA